MRKNYSCFGNTSELTVQVLNGIIGIDDFSYLLRVNEEGGKFSKKWVKFLQISGVT